MRVTLDVVETRLNPEQFGVVAGRRAADVRRDARAAREVPPCVLAGMLWNPEQSGAGTGWWEVAPCV